MSASRGDDPSRPVYQAAERTDEAHGVWQIVSFISYRVLAGGLGLFLPFFDHSAMGK